jgi:diadenylate cyclase
MLDSLLEIGLTDVIDVAVVGLLLWALIVWMRRVRANMALLGLAFLGLFYLIALQFELQMTAWIFQGFFAALVILLVVVFQDDLRRLFEQIAVLGLGRRPPRPDAGGVSSIFRALQQLARSRTGALLIIPGREPLERHLQGGIELDATISEELLLSIFDHHSPGHDGAVLVRGNRLAHFALHLPLSEDSAQLGPGGTRHAAALGLAEHSDALCVVVSEERGTISLATRGKLTAVTDPDPLLEALQSQFAYQGIGKTQKEMRWKRVRRRILEGVGAFSLALASWLAFVPGSAVDQAIIEVAVTVENMPEGFALEGVEPPRVRLTVTGPRRQLLLSQTDDFQVVVDALLVKLGRRTFAISPEAVHHPGDLEITSIDPEKIRISVRKTKMPPR